MKPNELGKPLALGRTAEIFRWGDRHVLKLFLPWCSRGMVEMESAIAHAVHSYGLQVPAPGEILEFNDRLGLVYELVTGPSLMAEIQNKPWMIVKFSRLMANLHADIHQKAAPGLEHQKARLERRIQAAPGLSESDKNGVASLLAALPESDKLCHGDFHPFNIMMGERGPVIIDWIDATQGNPLADVARTIFLARYAGLSTHGFGRVKEKAARFVMLQAYLREYENRVPLVSKQLEEWLIIIAAARLSENIEEERELTLKVVGQGLSKLGRKQK
jgi:aminoglycoside phosphotransferase (APT) family kinase protein